MIKWQIAMKGGIIENFIHSQRFENSCYFKIHKIIKEFKK